MRVLMIDESDADRLLSKLTPEAFRSYLLGGGRGETAMDGVEWAARVVRGWLESAGHTKVEPAPLPPLPQESKGGGS